MAYERDPWDGLAKFRLIVSESDIRYADEEQTIRIMAEKAGSGEMQRRIGVGPQDWEALA